MAEGGSQRRLAAIVAIDVAGYSRLMGADDAAAVAQADGVGRLSVGAEMGEGTFLVGLHQPRVACHVDCNDGRKPSLRTPFSHALLQTTNGAGNASQLSLERPRATENTSY